MNCLLFSPISHPDAHSIKLPTTPTIAILSTEPFWIRFLATLNESSHFIPPNIATYGLGGSNTAVLRAFISLFISLPAIQGISSVNPAREGELLWEVANASVTYASATPERFLTI